MTIYPFLIIATIVIVLFIVKKTAHDNAAKQLKMIYDKFSDKILSEKKSVKCETFTSGRKNACYLFRKCDLIFLENGLVILPFFTIGKFKIYTNFFFINENSLMGIGKIKRFNLNSFGNDFYIEFGESSFTSTNVEIRLKNLTQEEKSLINISE